MIRLSVRKLTFFLTLLGTSSCASAHVTSRPEQGALPIAGRLLQIAHVLSLAKIDSTWPGLKLPSGYGLCTTKDTAMYVTHDSMPWPERVITRNQVAMSKFAYILSPVPDDLSFPCVDLEYAGTGGGRIIISYMESMNHLDGWLPANIAFIVHESFHGHQSRTFPSTKGDPAYQVGQNPPLDSVVVNSHAFQNRIAKERVLLANAVRATTLAETFKVVREYIAIRSERELLLPQPQRGVEAHLERVEGTAQFVGYEVAVISTGPRTRLTDVIASDLLDENRYQSGLYQTMHVYDTGAAICYLLNRIAPEWRKQVEAGVTPWALLQSTAAQRNSPEPRHN